MYGTIMRARVKPGRRAEFEQLTQDIVPHHRDTGLVNFELAWEANDPDAVLAIIHFRDRESYERNADRPETDADYRRQLELLVGEPEWIDVEYGATVAAPA